MFSIIKRILRLSGKYRPRVIAGLIFNALKSCCAAFVFFAVLLVMLNIEHLTETVILQAFGIVALSVLGRFLFQYLSDVLMSASGYEIFREKRLEIGNQLKRAPMGYFTENNLGTVQTVLTTTISDLEGNCMLALTFLVGGFVQALAMTLMLGIPFLFFSNQTLEQYAGMFGESYLGILQTLVSPVTAIIMLVVVAICAFVGALNAKKLLKKHFKKAGMV